jgi:glutaminase
MILVVPGLMGVCLFSPRLDSTGNSIRAIQIARLLAKRYALHIFDLGPLNFGRRRTPSSTPSP